MTRLRVHSRVHKTRDHTGRFRTIRDTSASCVSPETGASHVDSTTYRDGAVFEWGSRGRRFESSRPDSTQDPVATAVAAGPWFVFRAPREPRGHCVGRRPETCRALPRGQYRQFRQGPPDGFPRGDRGGARAYDGIILAVAHDCYRECGAEDLRRFGRNNHVLFDLKCLFPADASDLRL